MTNTDVLKDNSYLYKLDKSGHAPKANWLNKIKSTLGLDENISSLRETIGHALQTGSQTDTSFSPQERIMLLNVLRIGTLRIDDVMVPRADIIAIDENESLSELLRIFKKAGHSRIPIYRETLDDCIGMVHIKDLMQWITTKAKKNQPKPVEKANLSSLDLSHLDLNRPISSTKIKRDVLFVPPSMSVVNLLLRMQTTRVHMALVVDEYGGTDGLVSIEDLVEEIVGEIEDEHDNEDEKLIYNDPIHGLIANARIPIEDLEEKLGKTLSIPDRDDEIDTLGGLVFSLVGRVPVLGELVSHPAGIEFEVLDADPRRIKRLKIHLNPKTKKTTKKKLSQTKREQTSKP